MIRTTSRSSLPVIVLVMALIAGACGTNAGSGAPAATSGSSTATGGSPAAGGSPAGGGSAAANLTGTLTVWAMGNEGTKLSILADAFTKANPGVKVNVTPVDWGQAVTRPRSRAARLLTSARWAPT